MKKNIGMRLAGLSILVCSFGFQALVHADDLMDTLSGKTLPLAPVTNQNQQNQVANPFRVTRVSVDLAKLVDPFQKHFYAQLETADQIPFDVQQWAAQVLNGNYEAASHLWSVVNQQLPEKLQNVATAANLYTLWKMNVNQTFFSQWMKALVSSTYAASSAESNLELTIGNNFDQWLIDNAIVLNAGQENTIAGLSDKNALAPTLKAWAMMRQGEKAETALNNLPPKSPLRYYLAETVALAHARKGDLVGVARIMKLHFEPIIKMNHSPVALSQYYMMIGRLLYQAGNLPAAKEYYEKVPNSSPEYLQAREELSWVLLRQGNIAQLRGEVKTLSSPLFKDNFAPDSYVVRAISNLKMCYYDAVQKDFDQFGANNKIWAKKIDDAMAASQAPAPSGAMDFYSNFATQSVKKLTAEKDRLDRLGKDSISAALPAVGIQKHWKEAQADITAALEIAKKTEDQEYRRQWKNQKTVLAEAMRKMRFVKVEYMTEIRQLAEGELDRSSLVADAGHTVPTSTLKTDSSQIVFPLDGEPWPDELFKLRSTAQARCLKNGGAK